MSQNSNNTLEDIYDHELRHYGTAISLSTRIAIKAYVDQQIIEAKLELVESLIDVTQQVGDSSSVVIEQISQSVIRATFSSLLYQKEKLLGELSKVKEASNG